MFYYLPLALPREPEYAALHLLEDDRGVGQEDADRRAVGLTRSPALESQHPSGAEGLPRLRLFLLSLRSLDRV